MAFTSFINKEFSLFISEECLLEFTKMRKAYFKILRNNSHSAAVYKIFSLFYFLLYIFRMRVRCPFHRSCHVVHDLNAILMLTDFWLSLVVGVSPTTSVFWKATVRPWESEACFKNSVPAISNQSAQCEITSLWKCHQNYYFPACEVCCKGKALCKFKFTITVYC